MASIGIFLLTIVINTLQSEAALSTRFPIGGLFNTETLLSSHVAFETIVKMGTTKTYHGRALKLNVVDSYSTALEICPFTSDDKGIAALIDARPTKGICDTTCLLCNRLNISHLSLGWEPTETIAEDLFTFLYHPPPELISKAYATLIKYLQWDKFTFLYEDEGSFVRQQEIIDSWPYTHDRIVFRKLNPKGDNREIFKQIIKVMHMSYHVLDCDVNNIRKYMKEIIDVDNSTQYQSFILTALDAYTVNLKDISDLMANVSTLHLTTRDEDLWKDIKMNTGNSMMETALTADALNHVEKAIRRIIENRKQRPIDGDDRTSVLYSQSPRIENPPALCFKDSKSDYEAAAWKVGNVLRDALLKTTAKGFTGYINFDKDGKRTNINLHYSKLSNESQFFRIGYWDSKTNVITLERTVTDRSSARNSKSVIKVVSKKGLPYFDIDTSNATAGVIYTGYAVDLIDAIFENIREKQNEDLRYEFYRVSGDKYGNPIAGTRKWDGMIGDLLEHRADLAICDLTITSDRNAVVDFSTPFMSLGISILMKEPPPGDPDMFSFIKPLALDVWLYLCTTYIIVSFVLLICARMSQADWVNPHPCNQNPENLENIWSLYNCMWLTMGAIMTQGCDILPRAAGSRWVTGMWWFFALIITASYTANMSTFVSNIRRSNEIADVTALSEQTKVVYGAVYNASTYKFFEVYDLTLSIVLLKYMKNVSWLILLGELQPDRQVELCIPIVNFNMVKCSVPSRIVAYVTTEQMKMSSNDPVYQKIWNVMKTARPTVFTTSNDQGKERVLRSKGNYAFFMESTAIEYYMQRNCSLKMLGSKLDSKDYGIAMPKNSPYKNLIDTAIIALQESGRLSQLKRKWWEEEGVTEDCKKPKNADEDSGSLQMKNTSGIFLVLVIGGVLGSIVAVIDFLLHARQICVNEKVTFREALASEWRSSFNPRALHKPAAPPRSAPPSTASPSPHRERSKSRAVSVLRAASSFINFDEIY